MRTGLQCFAIGAAVIGTLGASLAPVHAGDSDAEIVKACLEILAHGPRPLAQERAQRFDGKVSFDAVARCRGGEKAVVAHGTTAVTPWVDWPNYWAAADKSSRSEKSDSTPQQRTRAKIADESDKITRGRIKDTEATRWIDLGVGRVRKISDRFKTDHCGNLIATSFAASGVNKTAHLRSLEIGRLFVHKRDEA